MTNEIKAWIIIIVANIISIANDTFNFLPVNADKPNGWSNLYFIMVGCATAYLLMKSAMREALNEHNLNN